MLSSNIRSCSELAHTCPLCTQWRHLHKACPEISDRKAEYPASAGPKALGYQLAIIPAYQ